jgi:hypothetical protein
MEGNPSGFLTAHQSLQGYATEQWVEDKGYITGIDIQESAGWNEATTIVNNNSAIWNNTTNVVSSNSAQWGASNPQIPVTGINGIKISESGDKVVFEVSADYAEKDWVTAQGYLTAETDWTDTITAASANAYNEATAAIPAPFDPSYISAQVDTKLDSAIYAADSGTFLTALPQDLVYTADIADMATTGDLTGKQDSLTFGYHDTAISSIDNSALYDTSAQARINTLAGRISTLSSEKADTTALTAYQEITGMTAYQPAGAYLTTADSANFYTTANESGFISEVPTGTMNESAFGYDANDKISGYNGSAFAGGSDVPEGVMVESGLEYNAVNEISAYNGSAIAQYGAEKQWLVTDDTLVHLSNSAQFALGVNLSAVAQLLGVDETVLWSGSDTNLVTSFNTNEPITNFNNIKAYSMLFTDNEYIGSVIEYDVNSLVKTNEMNVGFSYVIDNGWKCWGAQKWHITNNSAFEMYRAGRVFVGPNSTAFGYNDQIEPSNGWVYKVIGIGRKS